jgi:hypothetical protein
MAASLVSYERKQMSDVRFGTVDLTALGLF